MPIIPADRQSQIAALVQEEGAVQVAELAERFAVSVLTIRRDLDQLAEQGQVERTHGGAIRRTTLRIEPEYTQKAIEHQEEKQAIAEAVLSYIETGDTLFINSGSTTLEVIKALLKSKKAVTIVTNNIDAVWLLEPESPCTLILTGGIYRTRSHSVSGSLSSPVIDGVYANKAIIGVDGFSVVAGLTTPVLEEAETTRKMISRTVGTVMVVTTSHKIGVVSNYKTVDASQVQRVITDSGAAGLLSDEELGPLELVLAPAKDKEG